MNKRNKINFIKILINSLYLSSGFIISHFFHIYSYRTQGADKLATIFGFFPNLESITLKSDFIAILCLSLVIFLISIIFQLIYFKNKEEKIRILIIFLFLAVLSSQVISSSLMRVLYETGYCFVFIMYLLIYKNFIQPIGYVYDNYEILWDLLKIFITIMFSVTIVFGGVGTIVAFYDTPKGFIHLQIYRHLLSILYLVIGITCLIIVPIANRILVLNERNNKIKRRRKMHFRNDRIRY